MGSGSFGFRKEIWDRLSDSMKVAITVNILPKEFRERLWERGQVSETMEYRTVRELLIRIGNGKMEQVRPTPMEVGSAENVGNDGMI